MTDFEKSDNMSLILHLLLLFIAVSGNPSTIATGATTTSSSKRQFFTLKNICQFCFECILLALHIYVYISTYIYIHIYIYICIYNIYVYLRLDIYIHA